MPDVSYGTVPRQSGSEPSAENKCTDAVCINASRIYDSCGSKDCLSNLDVFFTPSSQSIINNASSVKICKASVITADVNVESVAFHRGCYAVDVTFYFDIMLEAYTCGSTIPSKVNGLAIYGKRSVLYGSESNSKSFSSDSCIVCSQPPTACACSEIMPKATVQISEPMALSARLRKDSVPPLPCAPIPECVITHFGDDFAVTGDAGVRATIGIFTITQLERNVQLMIPSYDFCIPRKECKPESDDPCEVFNRVDFPNDSFFPPNARAEEREKCNFECSCNG